MDGTLIVATISAATAITVAALGYILNKRHERAADWRKLKLDHYKEYVTALSGVVGHRSSPDSQRRYSDAANLMTLVAPPSVLRALYDFQHAVRVGNLDKSLSEHDRTLNVLLSAIRNDVQPEAPNDEGFQFKLWDSPHPSEKTGRGV
jgi:hypothetical protein